MSARYAHRVSYSLEQHFTDGCGVREALIWLKTHTHGCSKSIISCEVLVQYVLPPGRAPVSDVTARPAL